jgi:hypothetical protein
LRNLRIERNGFGVSSALFNASVPVDGGKHTIVVTAPGMDPIRRTIEVPVEGALVSVDLALPPASAAPPSAPSNGAKPARRSVTKVTRPRRGRTLASRVIARWGV